MRYAASPVSLYAAKTVISGL